MKWLIVAALAAFQIGCAVRVIHNDVAATGPQRVYPLKSFLFAFIPATKLPPAAELCPGSQVSALDFGMAPSDVLLTWVTAGIYVPHQVQITCTQTHKN